MDGVLARGSVTFDCPEKDLVYGFHLSLPAQKSGREGVVLASTVGQVSNQTQS